MPLKSLIFYFAFMNAGIASINHQDNKPPHPFALDSNVKINSSILNETDKELTLTYNLCTYKYDKNLNELFDYSCIARRTLLNKNEKIDFDLQSQLINWPNLFLISAVYITKIQANNLEQIFLKNKEDEKEFERYFDKTKKYGVHKWVFMCRLLELQEKAIVSTSKGFLCY